MPFRARLRKHHDAAGCSQADGADDPFPGGFPSWGAALALLLEISELEVAQPYARALAALRVEAGAAYRHAA